jgi:diaminopimelate decarboxylase
MEAGEQRGIGLQREHGIVLPEINLGGGFGIAYTSDHTPLAPKNLAD